MGRLGDHPNIVPIHDLGEDDGQPYMVLPLMTGGDVEGLIDSTQVRERRSSNNMSGTSASYDPEEQEGYRQGTARR